MERKDLSELSDKELLQEAKKVKSAAMLSALVIGIMGGVIIYSVAKNTVGFFTLIPLFFAYKLLTNSKDKERNELLKSLLTERGLK
ncbi:MAG: FUSC family protein [Salibacteraceae bacterium]